MLLVRNPVPSYVDTLMYDRLMEELSFLIGVCLILNCNGISVFIKQHIHIKLGERGAIHVEGTGRELLSQYITS